MNDILYTVAADKYGKLTKANDAEKGHDFFCPACKEKFILRKSGNTGPRSKRPHFAHRASTNCTPETALHLVFKTFLAEKIQQHITEQKPLPISWICKYCLWEHSGNLLKKANAVKIEHNMIYCKPDIALFDCDGNVYAVIEIVVTHKPAPKILKIHDERNITLVQINLNSDKDIDELESKVAKPDIVNLCLNTKCKTCGIKQQKIVMTIIDTHCWKCDSIMKVAIIQENGIKRSKKSSVRNEFTHEEVVIAENKGVIIQNSPKGYLANTCPACGIYINKLLLFDEYLIPALNGDHPPEFYDIGYHCTNCENRYYKS